MRVLKFDDTSFTVTPLKGKHIRQLKAEGYDIMKGGYDVLDGMDKVFAIQGFDQAAVDELAFSDVLALHKAVVAETFGTSEEEKN